MEKVYPDDHSAIIVGCPPAYRGGTTKGTDLEIQLIKLFPKTAYFIEKVGAGHMAVSWANNLSPSALALSKRRDRSLTTSSKTAM
jgi:hypothetical protein